MPRVRSPPVPATCLRPAAVGVVSAAGTGSPWGRRGEAPVTGEAADEQELADLRASARGWHTVQMAVLGFIGLCGVLQRAGGACNPRWLQVLAGALVLASLVVACAATLLVATVAWPLGAGQPADRGASALAAGTARVRRGIALTFVAVAVLALAASSSWWPTEEPADAAAASVRVTTRAGVLCGTLLPAEQGRLALDVGGRRAVLSTGDVVAIAPVEGCA